MTRTSISSSDLASKHALRQGNSPQDGAAQENGKFLPGLQLAYSLIAALLYIGTAFILGLIGVVNQIGQGGLEPARLISLGWSTGLLGVLLLPAAVFAIYRLSNRGLPGWITRLLSFLDRVSLYLILAWPFVLILGYLAARISSLNWLIMPPFNLLAVGLPILWLLAIGRRRLPAGSPLRLWGVLSVGVVLTPVLAFIIELAVLVGLAVLVIILVSSNPGAYTTITTLSQRLMSSQGDPETISRILRPILAQPMVIFGGLALMSGVIPLIEELLKPLPVWLLGKRLTTPVEGFVAGLIGGTGFTLAESLGASSAFEPSQWITVTFARAGTDLLHILNAGLMGWALVCAWQQRKYLRLALTYLLVVAIHGLWNFFSLWAGFYSLITPAPQDLFSFPSSQIIISPIGLGVLFIGMLALLFWRNASLRPKAVAVFQNASLKPGSGFTPAEAAAYNAAAGYKTTAAYEDRLPEGYRYPEEPSADSKPAAAQGSTPPKEPDTLTDSDLSTKTQAGEAPAGEAPAGGPSIEEPGADAQSDQPSPEKPPSDTEPDSQSSIN